MTRSNLPGYSETRSLPALIGVPWKSGGRTLGGCDCWGIVRLGAMLVYGIKVPNYSAYTDADDMKQTAPLFERRAEWLRIEPGTERGGDVVVLKIAGTPAHAGLVLDGGRMLHSLAGRDSCLERYRAPAWSQRIDGFYRWQPH